MGFNFNRDNSLQTSAVFGGSRLSQKPSYSQWLPGLWDADTAQRWEREDTRAYSRDLDASSAPARSGVDKSVQYRVGTGLRLQSKIIYDWLNLTQDRAEEWQDNTERRFEMWASDVRASVDGQQNFYELQALIATSEVVSGDVVTIVARKKRNGWPFQTALQVIEADRVCNENNQIDTDKVYEGIKRADDGEVISIYVAKYHPYRFASARDANTWTEVKKYASNGRRNFLHRMKTRRPGQTRGMPRLAPVVELLKGVTRYSEAELEAAVNSAALAIFAQMDTDSFKDLFEANEQQQWIEGVLRARGSGTPFQSGQILNTLPGETISSPTPGRPNPNFGAFVDNFYTMLGMGLNIPKETLTGFYQSSYTAARAALQQFWQAIYIERASDVVHTCSPAYEGWLTDCVADGIISAPGFLNDPFIRYAWSRSEWAGSQPGSLNPLQEAQAARLRAGFLTSEADEIVGYDGGDPRTRRQQQIREAKERRENGLPPVDQTPIVNQPAT